MVSSYLLCSDMGQILRLPLRGENILELDMRLRKNGRILAEEVIKALQSLDGWGSLEIFVQDHKVTQITRRAIRKTEHNLKEESSATTK